MPESFSSERLFASRLSSSSMLFSTHMLCPHLSKMPEASRLCMYLQVLIEGGSLHSVLLDAPGLPQPLQLLLLALR